MPKKKTHKLAVKTLTEIHVTYIYEEVMEEWLAPYGFQGNTPIDFADGTTIRELYDNVITRVAELNSPKVKYVLIHDVDIKNTPKDRQAEALGVILAANS